MNKTVAFVLGMLTGAAGGSAATYYIYKKFRDEDEEIREEEMQNYYEERYNKKLEERDHHVIKKVEPPEEKKEERDDEKVTNNEGVKKYHHDNGLESAYGSARIFGEDAKPKTKGVNKVIKEISQHEYLNGENGYDKQTVDVFMSNDDDEPEIVGIWAYETDNEEMVDKRFGKSIEELLDGRTYDDLMRYCIDVNSDGTEVEEVIGALYLKNDELKIDFEFVIHNN